MDTLQPARDWWCPTCQKWIPQAETVVVPSPVMHKVRNHIIKHDGDPKVVRHTVCSEKWTPPVKFES